MEHPATTLLIFLLLILLFIEKSKGQNPTYPIVSMDIQTTPVVYDTSNSLPDLSDSTIFHFEMNTSLFEATTTQKMTILGNNTAIDNYVCIVTTFTSTFKLNVQAGDINLNTFTNAYRIEDGSTNNSFPVLWRNNHTEDIFVGVNAVNANTIYNNTSRLLPGCKA